MARSIETLKVLQANRKLYSDAMGRFVDHAVELRTALEQEATNELDAKRESCCQTLTRDVINAHIDYVEVVQLYWEGDHESLREFVTDDLVTDLKRFTRYLKMLNSEALLSKIENDRRPLSISSHTAKAWKKLPLAIPLGQRHGSKELVWDLVDALCAEDD